MAVLYLLEMVCMMVNKISVYKKENVELITVELPGVVVHSIYQHWDKETIFTW